MARNGPLYTLLAGGLLGAGLLIAAMVSTPDEVAADNQEPAATESPAVDEPTPTPEPTVEPSAEPTAEPTPSPTEAEVSTTYVGYVDGGGASVAVVVTGDEAIAYVCDGDSVEAWLDGSAAAGELDLAGDGGSLTATYDDSQAIGETALGDDTWTFTVEAVDPPEGLYRFADTIAGGAEVVGGWIVLPDGTQVGVLDVEGETRPAPAFDVVTGEVTIDGTAVTPERLG